MEALRLTMNSARLTPIIDLPLALCDQEVDVIVLPSRAATNTEETDNEKPKVESVMGILKEYANPALREQVESKEQPCNSEYGSTMGCLHEYANPSLRELEKGAWERAAVEKYLEKMHNEGT